MPEELKTKRDLSGIYFRWKNPETGKFENRCFEDLPEEDQNIIMDGKSIEWHKKMVLTLSGIINRIGDEFNIEAK